MCKQESSSDKSTKIYTRKELLMMDTTISDFIPDTIFHPSKSWLFNLPHVCILGINHCDEMRRTAFKRRKLLQDFSCCRDYAERVVARFANQIQPEYYDGNI